MSEQVLKQEPKAKKVKAPKAPKEPKTLKRVNEYERQKTVYG